MSRNGRQLLVVMLFGSIFLGVWTAVFPWRLSGFPVWLFWSLWLSGAGALIFTLWRFVQLLKLRSDKSVEKFLKRTAWTVVLFFLLIVASALLYLKLNPSVLRDYLEKDLSPYPKIATTEIQSE